MDKGVRDKMKDKGLRVKDKVKGKWQWRRSMTIRKVKTRGKG